MHNHPYRGRFAPTPSGPLHFGSLLAALASFLDARHQQGQWLLRIEDLDTPRLIPGATDAILHTLERHGLYWDGVPLQQSSRLPAYRQLIDDLLQRGLAYYCDCSRSQLAASHGLHVADCRSRRLPPGDGLALRLAVKPGEIGFKDRLQGYFAQDLQADTGDFVIVRRDGIVAYQLAVVADDIHQQITDVVRGADLLDSTPRQLWLYRLLGAQAPDYLHIPLATRRDGNKLSKRLGSPPLDPQQVPHTLFLALQILRQQPPQALYGAGCEELLSWAIANWQVAHLPALRELPAELCPAGFADH